MATRPLNHDLETSKRRLPVGAETGVEGGVHFRVWAPLRSQVRAVLESGPGSPAVIALEPDPGMTVTTLAFALRRQPEPSTGTSSITILSVTRIRRRAISPTGLMDRRRSSIRVPSPGPIRSGEARRERARSSMRCTSERSPGRGIGRARSAS